jgi:hypothetical protein
MSEQFWIWAEWDDGFREQVVTIPFATRIGAEKVIASLVKLRRPGSKFFVSTTGEEQEAAGFAVLQKDY